MKKLSFILELVDKTRDSFSKVSAGFDKVNQSAKKTQSSLKLLPNSISALELKLDSLKKKQADAFTVEGIKHYQKEINLTQKELNKLNSNKFSGFQKIGNQIGGQVPGMAGIANALTSPAALGIGAGIGIGKTFYDMTDKAMVFESGMSKVNGTLQLSQPELKKVRDELLTFGKNSTTALESVPDAFYKIVSATGGDLPVSMDIMKQSLKGAEAGFTDVNNVADATVNIVNAVGKSNTNANEVMDVLFSTLNKGKVEFTDIANYLPKLIPISNNLGTSFKETSGAFAFLTANGLKAEASTTSLQNVFKAFGTEKIRQNFKKFGIQIFDSEGKMRKMADISKELGVSLDGLTDEQRVKKLESLGLDQEASLGLAIMSSNANELGKTIDYVGNSAGEMQRTLDKSQNPLNTIKKLGNQFSGLMTEIGYKILPVVNVALEKALGWITGITEGISTAYEKSALFRDVVDGIGWAISSLWDGATMYFSSLSDSFDKASKEMEKYGYSWKKLGEDLETTYSWHKKQIIGFVNGAIGVLRLLKDAWDGLWSGDATAFEKLSIKNIRKAFYEGYQKNQTKDNATASVIEIIKPTAPDIVSKKKINSILKQDDNSKIKSKDIASGIDSVVGGGKQAKNITINITKLVEMLSVNSNTLTEGLTEVQGMVEEALLRVLNSANSMSNG
jgi:TP901 family phage tail tape measure protein